MEQNTEVQQQTPVVKDNPQLLETENRVNRVPVIIMIVVTVLSLSSSAFLYYQNTQLKKQVTQTQKTQPIQLTVSPTPSPTPSNIFKDESLKINYFPVQYMTNSKQIQKVAQTFTLDEDKIIESVELKASFGVGDNIKLSIYEAGNVSDLTKGTLVGSGLFPATDIVKEIPFKVILDKPVQIKANKEYSIVIEPSDNLTQTAIAFSERDILDNGKMYKYTRLIGGNGEIIDEQHSWQPINNQDLLYSLVSGE